jgi:uncharacterized damage-inducible protein DinB
VGVGLACFRRVFDVLIEKGGMTLSDVLKQQYAYIRATREVLFRFLETIAVSDLHRDVSHFGNGSIIKTHIHAADCYRYWLGSFALKEIDFQFATEAEIAQSDLRSLRARFESVDQLVQRFIEEFYGRWSEPLERNVRNQAEPLIATPLWLLTHTETHEFHHKGQIVSIARSLGYTPPDTDLVL